jgi:pyridoxamine 5'-phosphate oxidase
MSELHIIRKEYRSLTLDIDQLHEDPIIQFKTWLNDSLRAEVDEPTAMSLATVSNAGQPSSRMVLLKKLDEEGFTFFTNYDSRKGIEIDGNPLGALLFFWAPLERQVRVEGRIYKTRTSESEQYFNTRPEGSRIGAWASPQSRRIPSRAYLERLQQDFQDLSKKTPLEKPEHWGGYKLVPHLIEFWQGRENRLHDRFEYIRNHDVWEIHRLAP